MINQPTASKTASHPIPKDWRIETLRPFVKKFQQTPRPLLFDLEEEQTQSLLDTEPKDGKMPQTNQGTL